MRTLLLFIVSAYLALHASAQQASTEKLEKLKLSFQQAMERATKPIKTTYQTELEKLKIEYTKAGNLEAALAVDAELKDIVVSSPATPSPMAAQVVSRDQVPKEAHRLRDCYVLGVNAGREISWADAKAECEKMGGRLVTISDERKWADILAYRGKAKIGRFWTGAHRAERDGKWIWMDGTEVKFIGVPKDGTNGNIGGLQIDSGQGWNFYPLNVSFGTTGFICEWPRK